MWIDEFESQFHFIECRLISGYSARRNSKQFAGSYFVKFIILKCRFSALNIFRNKPNNKFSIDSNELNNKLAALTFSPAPKSFGNVKTKCFKLNLLLLKGRCGSADFYSIFARCKSENEIQEITGLSVNGSNNSNSFQFAKMNNRCCCCSNSIKKRSKKFVSTFLLFEHRSFSFHFYILIIENFAGKITPDVLKRMISLGA